MYKKSIIITNNQTSNTIKILSRRHMYHQEFSTNLKFGYSNYDRELNQINRLFQRKRKQSCKNFECKREQRKSKTKLVCLMKVCMNAKSQSISFISIVELNSYEIKKILKLKFITGHVIG